MLWLAVFVCALVGGDEIVSMVLTEGGVERPATRRELGAYELYNAGVAASTRNEYDAAMKYFEMAIEIFPKFPEARINLGNLLADHVSLESALDMYESAKACADHATVSAQASSNLGHTLHRIAKRIGYGIDAMMRAASYFEEAIRLSPSFVDARFNFGSLLQDMDRASEAEEQYLAALAIDPKHQNARLNLANIYFARGDSAQAAHIQLDLAEDEIVANKTRLNALNNLGQTYRDVDDHETAAKIFQRAHDLSPTDPTTLANLNTARRTLCDWNAVELSHEELLRSEEMDSLKGVMPYDALFIPRLSNRQIRDLTAAHLERKFGRRQEGRRQKPTVLDTNREHLNVGYLSYDFRQHPMGYLTRRLISGGKTVKVAALSYGENDGSKLRTRAETESDVFVELGNSSLTYAKSAIPDDLDIVVDLMAHTRGARIELPAVIHDDSLLLINYLGYPGTAGGRHYDYTLADAKVVPAESVESQFAEPLIMLPRTYQANDYALFSPLPPSQPREDDNKSLRFCNFNNVDKFEPNSWTTWMNLLRRVKGSTLTLLKPKGPLGDRLIETLGQEAAARGIVPWLRLIWAPRLSKARHLKRIAEDCDVFLDTFVYGAHTTGSDALWAGVPLVTVRGFGTDPVAGRFSSRVGVSLLETLGLADVTALDTVKQFEDLVASEGGGAFLRNHATIFGASLRSSLFDAEREVKDLERAYKAAFEAKSFSGQNYHIVVGEGEDEDSLKRCASQTVMSELGGEARCVEAYLYEDDEENPADALSRALGLSARLAMAFPKDADSRHSRGLALHMAGEHSRAAVELRVACQLAPRGTDHFWANLGHVHRAAAHSSPDLRQHLFQAAAAYLEAGAVGDFKATMMSRVDESDPVASLRAVFAVSVLDDSDAGAKLRLGAALDDVGRGGDALDEWLLRAVPQRHEQRFQAEDSPLPFSASSSLRVAIVCDEYGQTWWPGWGPSSLVASGLGGSEEAVVFLGRELARLGLVVHVFLEKPPDSDVGEDIEAKNLSWWPLSRLDPEEYDVFVAWRYHISTGLAKSTARGGKTYVWLQDVPPVTSWTPSFVEDRLSGIFVLSHFHGRTLPDFARAKARVTPNGIDPNQLVDDARNDPLTFVYGSAPNRGLYDLLRIWPQIRGELGPSATLVVYYGFSKSFEKWGATTIPHYSKWREEVMRLLHQDGVVYRGMVDHATLAAGYAEAGFLLYPTVYPETGCVTLMKAMAMGAIPITSKYANSVVPELSGRFDLGPKTPRRAPTTVSTTINASDPSDEAWMSDFAQSAIEAARAGLAGRLENHRAEMRADARSRFLWRHVAESWARIFSSESSP